VLSYSIKNERKEKSMKKSYEGKEKRKRKKE